ncbi:MAG: sigma-70 family RNA polymerase sigma factor [Muribaculaceae bacterium]|nr:sigma-70 family RNA polymerase sigma factor [Muribaculaceae bacterium]
MYAFSFKYRFAWLDLWSYLRVLGSRICMRTAKGVRSTGYQSQPITSPADFRILLREYDSEISRICFGYARSRDEFEDLRQDALINIWQGLRTYHGNASLRTWIYRVTLNSCVSNFRYLSKKVPTERLDDLYDVLEEEDSHRKLISELHYRISCLSPTDKAIILMWLDEFSYDEIASVCGLPRNTIATRLRRAKEKLKEMESL